MQLFRVTTLNYLKSSVVINEASAIQLGQCQGLLQAWWEGITKGERNTMMPTALVAAVVVVVVCNNGM